MSPTNSQIARAVRTQQALIESGDRDLWQQACSREQVAAHGFANVRMGMGKAPLATAFGMIVQAGFLLHAMNEGGDKEYAISQALAYLRSAIQDGPDDPDEPALSVPSQEGGT